MSAEASSSEAGRDYSLLVTELSGLASRWQEDSWNGSEVSRAEARGVAAGLRCAVDLIRGRART